jgi:hypothetical protein
MADDDFNEWPRWKQMLWFLRPFLVGFGLITLIYMSAYIGAGISCSGQYLDGWKCVEPVKVDVVQVCEYKAVGCFKTCVDVMVKDKDAFYGQFGHQLLNLSYHNELQ